MLYSKIELLLHFFKCDFCLYLQTEGWVKIIFSGNQQSEHFKTSEPTLIYRRKTFQELTCFLSCSSMATAVSHHALSSRPELVVTVHNCPDPSPAGRGRQLWAPSSKTLHLRALPVWGTAVRAVVVAQEAVINERLWLLYSYIQRDLIGRESITKGIIKKNQWTH